MPDVRRPGFVLTYMSGKTPALVVNRGRCTCTNALLAVDLRSGLFDDGAAQSGARLSNAWDSPAARLSCELEGHPLGGGMLKLEPGEARHVLLVPDEGIDDRDGGTAPARRRRDAPVEARRMNVCEWWSLRSALAHFRHVSGDRRRARDTSSPRIGTSPAGSSSKAGSIRTRCHQFRSSTMPLSYIVWPCRGLASSWNGFKQCCEQGFTNARSCYNRLCFGTMTWSCLVSGGRLIEESRQCREQSRAVESLAFPDHQHFPTECVKRRDIPSVPLHVLFELLAPILGTGSWRRRSATASVSMPETPMYEDNLSQTRKRQIRRARQVAAMEAKAVTQRVRHAANGSLRFSCPFPRIRRISADRFPSIAGPARFLDPLTA